MKPADIYIIFNVFSLYYKHIVYKQNVSQSKIEEKTWPSREDEYG